MHLRFRFHPLPSHVATACPNYEISKAIILNDSEESRPIHGLPKARSFGAVYPENIEALQDDIETRSLRRGDYQFTRWG